MTGIFVLLLGQAIQADSEMEQEFAEFATVSLLLLLGQGKNSFNETVSSIQGQDSAAQYERHAKTQRVKCLRKRRF